LALLTQRTVGVVGTRTCSAYGQAAAAALVPPLCAADVAIVSGLARGIDSLAHRLAMGTAGSTIGVIGNGLTHFYPREHIALQQVMMHDQLVLSPFPPTTPPRPYQFPQRNRIIAGLSHALLVIEARERSGSLITASLAQDANRLVAAVPGRICDPLSAGCNALIADGAIPVHSAADLLRELPDEAF
jgi:DNA processing protein